MTDTATEQQFDLDDVFDRAGGGSGAPSFAWPLQDDPRKPDRKVPVIGGSIQGEITDIYVTVVKDPDKDNAPKLDKNGKQQPQVNLTIQTTQRNWEGCKNVPTNEDGTAKDPAEDTGERRIYVKFRMLDALAKAIKESEQKKGGPRKGAKVAVRVKDLQYSTNLMRHPLPDYEAKYVPPVETPADDMFTQQQDQMAAAASTADASQDPWASAAGGDEPPF
jgi:hypothetical protein